MVDTIVDGIISITVDTVSELRILVDRIVVVVPDVKVFKKVIVVSTGKVMSDVLVVSKVRVVEK